MIAQNKDSVIVMMTNLKKVIVMMTDQYDEGIKSLARFVKVGLV